MAKGQYVGVGGAARKVKQIYVGASSVARKAKSGYVGVSGVARRFFQSGYTWKRSAVNYGVSETKIFQKSCFDYDYPYSGVVSYYNGRVGNLKGTTTSPIRCDAEGLYIPSGTLTYPGSSTGSAGFNIQTSRSIQWFCANESTMITDTDDESGDTSPYFIPDGIIREDLRYKRMYRVVGNYSQDYYYTYLVQPKTSQGSYMDEVTSEDPAAYPENGEQDGYWYVKQ